MTRELRRELRSLDNRIDETGDPSFADSDIDLITDGLSADEPKTRKRAVRVLKSAPAEIVPYDRLQEALTQVIERAIDTEDNSARRAAEMASRVIAEQHIDTDFVDDTITDLGERMLAEHNARLRTGGAVLIDLALFGSEYQPDNTVVDNLLEHIAASELLIESFDRRLDAVQPAYLALSKLDDTHADDIADCVERGSFDEYLHAHHDDTRKVAAQVLESIAAAKSETVASYSLDLALRLRDDNETVVLFAGKALNQVAKATDVDVLRPLTQVVDQALPASDPPAFAGILDPLTTIMREDPAWVTELPLDELSSYRSLETVQTEPPLRSKLASILGHYAKHRDQHIIDESFPEFVIETATTDWDDDAYSPNHPQLGLGLGTALRADPDRFVPVTLEHASQLALNDVDAVVEETLLSPLVQSAISDARSLEDLDDEVWELTDQSNERTAYRVVLVAFRHAFEQSAAAREAALALIADDQAPRERRALAAEAFAVSVTSDLDPESEFAAGLTAAGEALSDSSTEYLNQLGDYILNQEFTD